MSFKRKYWYPISVDIEIRLRKLRKIIDRIYLRTWSYLFALFILTWLGCGFIIIKHDYDLLTNYANLDAPFQSIYTSWRTDGNPGQDPPK